ncbi:MAG: DUF4846 domain-containing protein, partial [Cytophagales bacterium]|nr:DUF4846 domain-containing protein [Cytophagales bacterium]
MKILILIGTLFCLKAFGQNGQADTNARINQIIEAAFSPSSDRTGNYISPEGKTIETRFQVPEGFERISLDNNSFGNYLRTLPLKPHGSQVMLYNGVVKPNLKIYEAVVSLKIGDKNLHQCADAIMRLRAEYLWKQ